MKRTLFFLIYITFISCGSNSSNPIAVKSEHPLLFVGTYTDKEGHVDGQADGIYGLRFNPEDGSLSETTLKVKTTNPSYLFVDNEAQKIYSVNEKVGEEEKISAFAYDDSGIKFLNELPANGGAPCYITKMGDHIVTANYVGGNHAVISLHDDGRLDKVTDIYQNLKQGPEGEARNSHAHMIILNPYNKKLIGVDLGTDKLTFFDLDQTEGKLTVSSELYLTSGAGPRHLDFHPSLDVFYVVNELNGTISVVKNIADQYKVIQEEISTRNPNNEDASCADIHVHPSGKYLFASNRGPFNTISQYHILEDGSIELYGEHTSGGAVPRSFTFDPSGEYLLVANQNSNNILTYLFDQERGQLIDTGKSFEAPTPVCLKFE